ncbi:hypothetical protein RchiOBHm_Chr6g0250441 [Rosa chinensis]|uniref:Uncharacterized protein n=1 Tax=Rosa chinensis TaxID=74649 RepID=A0A2P6PKK9_ROSCH|nr:hypothetical protein RchiOBHm_Chr6g0250441 [Rosa chinensis]
MLGYLLHVLSSTFSFHQLPSLIPSHARGSQHLAAPHTPNYRPILVIFLLIPQSFLSSSISSTRRADPILYSLLLYQQ